MTKAQLEVSTEQDLEDLHYRRRTFRKKCVTQGIVTFMREDGYHYYIVRYRGQYVATLYGDSEYAWKLRAMWNTIEIAEETIEMIEGVKHEGK